MLHMKKRVLSFMLTVVMVLSLLPMQVFANVNIGETQISYSEDLEITTDSNAKMDDEFREERTNMFRNQYAGVRSGFQFANEEELESKLADAGKDDVFFYNGFTTFSVRGELEIPEGVLVNFMNQDVVVEDDAELIVDGSISCKSLQVIGEMVTTKEFDVQELTVKGTLSASEYFYVSGDVVIDGIVNAYHAFYCAGDLTVDGELHVYDDTLFIKYPHVVSGMDNIRFKKEWQKLYYDVLVNNGSELENKVKLFAETSDVEEICYQIQISVASDNNKIDFILDRNVTIPTNVELNLYNASTFEIAAGATLTNNGSIYNPNAIVVNGKLVNNKNIEVVHRNEHNTQGTITLGSKGSYCGEGELWVNTNNKVTSLDNVLMGFHFDDFDIEKYYNSSAINWVLYYEAGKIKLGTPINLSWGTEYREQWQWDEDTDTDLIVGYDTVEKPGFISWETVRPDQASARIQIYEVGKPDAVMEGSWSFDVERQPKYRSVDDFLRAEVDFPTGDYYFTVQSTSDNKEYRNSDVADSRYNADGGQNPAGIYHYVRPNEQLAVVDQLQWEDHNDNFFRWAEWNDNNTESKYIDGYWVLYYFSETIDGEYRQVSGSSSRGDQKTEKPFYNDMFESEGQGYYKFKVKVLSNDIEKMRNSEWSDFSPVLNVKQISNDVNSDLNDIIDNVQNGVTNKEDILDSVQNIDRNDLEGALVADKDKSGTTQKIEELENLVLNGQKTPITVNNAAAAFNPQDISIVGANLNNKVNDTNDLIELVVDKPEQNHVIPERYNSAVSVSFSMTLDHVENPKNLAVPVKITLPIPTSINPDFLVVFHYHVDGGYDVINPYVYQKGGKWYADFVLTSFSDFIMTTEHELTKVDAKPATYTEAGNIEYYTCECCDSVFADENAKKKITLADTIIPKKTHASSSGGSSSSSGKHVQTPTANTATLPAYVTTGTWTSADGIWMFTDSKGEVYKNRWAAVVNPYANVEAGQSPFDWFFFDETGKMMTGWIMDNGLWYYLNPVSDGTRGKMMIGWQQIEGKWYYFNPESDGTKGKMVTNTWVGNYHLNENGVWDATTSLYSE